MEAAGTFPFGQPVRILTQDERTPKRVFVLGVYASAVHAKWQGPDGKTKVQALAVASEPCIFWRGDGADAIIAAVDVPAEAGRLEPASAMYNGPSGIGLDESFLHPLGLSRGDAWLCDLVPHSCMNDSQRKAVEKSYMPLVQTLGLPEPTVPAVPSCLADDARREEIVREIDDARAEVIILLGDQPVRWFLRHFHPRWSRLADFGETEAEYGQLHDAAIGGRRMQALPLAHPRQTEKLGRSSGRWYNLHQAWLDRTVGHLLQ